MTTNTQQTIAKHLDLSGRSIRKMIEVGILTKEANGKLDKDKCRVAYIRHLRQQAAGRSSGDDTDYDLIAERARLAKFQADKVEMEMKRLNEELLPADEVMKSWQGMIMVARSRLLAMPTKLAPLLAAATSPHDTQQIVKKEVYAALTELAQMDPEEVDEKGEEVLLKAGYTKVSAAGPS